MAITSLLGTPPAFKNATVGPWKIGTTWYRLALIDGRPVIERSSDALTWPNRVYSAGTSMVTAVGCVDGTNIHIAGATATQVTVWTYSTTTDTFGSTGSVLTVANTSVNTTPHITLVPRGNGQVAVGFTSAVGVISMVNYRRFSLAYGTPGGATDRL